MHLFKTSTTQEKQNQTQIFGLNAWENAHIKKTFFKQLFNKSYV